MKPCVKFKKLHPEASLPTRGTAQSAGMDLRSNIAVTIYPGEAELVKTGIAMSLPPGFEGQVRPRSGLALRHRITVLNSPGTIDSDFRGEVGVILINHGDTPFGVLPGDRIAQLVIAEVCDPFVVEVDTLDETERGTGGFGSTGK